MEQNNFLENQIGIEILAPFWLQKLFPFLLANEFLWTISNPTSGWMEMQIMNPFSRLILSLINDVESITELTLASWLKPRPGWWEGPGGGVGWGAGLKGVGWGGGWEGGRLLVRGVETITRRRRRVIARTPQWTSRWRQRWETDSDRLLFCCRIFRRKKKSTR